MSPARHVHGDVVGDPVPGGPAGATVRSLIAWLMDGDPAVRWQVMRDLLGAPDAAVAEERAQVATRGWGARLLAAQDPDGRWAGGLYSPKWTSTTYTLLLLQRFGLPGSDPQAHAGCRLLWDSAARHDGGLTFGRTSREPETCITGMLVLLAAAFGLDDERVDRTVHWLLRQQLPDGGWNCDSIRRGSTHGSFHTSITVLEALHAYGGAGGQVAVDRHAERGRAFFLAHRLYRSHRTGAVVDPALTRFPFPPQWHYDIVRGLEHFRAAGAERDGRMADAVDEVRRRRARDGTWRTYRPYPGRYWFELERSGAPSRWATFRALRVLRWWRAD
ncbi:MAG TPA: hypothetical protein VK923_15570 [Euzebyales bacterium]|nr:hypothetical protein [Euzebyales bacterium]